MYILRLIILTVLLPKLLMGQPEKGMVRSGNKEYRKNNFQEAEIRYRKALEKNPKSFQATFNLGNSLYKQEKYQEAASQYQAAGNLSSDNTRTAWDYHNLGNSLFKMQKYLESIEAYKQALRLNPDDEDTRYNLAYAQRMLKQQEQNNQNQNQNQQNQNQQNQNQQGSNNQQEEQQKQSSPSQEPDRQQNNQDKPQPGSPSSLSREDAERLLQALRANEKEIVKRLNRIEGQHIKAEKQW